MSPELELFLIPGLPLLACLLFSALALKPGRERSAPAWLIIALAGSLLLSVKALAEVADGHSLHASVPWLHVGPIRLQMGAHVDGLAAVMLIVVSSVSLLVQIYSTGYMRGEIGYGRYFAYMSLFSGSMLGLVIADNIVQMYIFWELVGICSYLLIGFWYRRPSAAAAAKKAFVVTRFGDLGFFAAVLVISLSGGAVFGFEDLARSLGIPNVHVLDPVKVRTEFERLLAEALASRSLTLLIVRRPCLLAAKRNADQTRTSQG
ncbi:MAG: hypothetical protein MUQ65_06140 [Armatimonadetes bacterium]|nr:hypothetical protein [Armatimonadota bacterium]